MILLLMALPLNRVEKPSTNNAIAVNVRVRTPNKARIPSTTATKPNTICTPTAANLPNILRR